jgi:hypothetical protein
LRAVDTDEALSLAPFSTLPVLAFSQLMSEVDVFDSEAVAVTPDGTIAR